MLQDTTKSEDIFCGLLFIFFNIFKSMFGPSFGPPMDRWRTAGSLICTGRGGRHSCRIPAQRGSTGRGGRPRKPNKRPPHTPLIPVSKDFNSLNPQQHLNVSFLLSHRLSDVLLSPRSPWDMNAETHPAGCLRLSQIISQSLKMSQNFFY